METIEAEVLDDGAKRDAKGRRGPSGHNGGLTLEAAARFVRGFPFSFNDPLPKFLTIYELVLRGR